MAALQMAPSSLLRRRLMATRHICMSLSMVNALGATRQVWLQQQKQRMQRMLLCF